MVLRTLSAAGILMTLYVTFVPGLIEAVAVAMKSPECRRMRRATKCSQNVHFRQVLLLARK